MEVEGGCVSSKTEGRKPLIHLVVIQRRANRGPRLKQAGEESWEGWLGGDC